MDIEVDTSGFQEIARRAEEMQEERDITLEELLTSEFLQTHTPYGDLHALLVAAGVAGDLSASDLEDIRPQMDAEIAAHTDYADLQALLQAAFNAYVGRSLGIDLVSD